jgi:hypothetical protein
VELDEKLIEKIVVRILAVSRAECLFIFWSATAGNLEVTI